MISFYLFFILNLYLLLKSLLHYVKAYSPISLFVALAAAAYQVILSDIYYKWDVLNFERFAPFKDNQLYWTSSFLIIFMLITINSIYRDFLHNKSVSDLVRDIAIDEAIEM